MSEYYEFGLGDRFLLICDRGWEHKGVLVDCGGFDRLSRDVAERLYGRKPVRVALRRMFHEGLDFCFVGKGV